MPPNHDIDDVDAEVDRLNDSHFQTWAPLTGDLVPKDVQEQLKRSSTPRVADIGTGTGIWLLSLAATLPRSAELHGYDIDSSMFPAPLGLPSNILLKKHDALQQWPKEMIGTYDVVHVRQLAQMIKREQWEPMFRNILTLLKSGGWIVWEDTAESSWRAMPPSKVFDEWWASTTAHAYNTGRDPTMPTRLLSLTKRVGLWNCQEKIWSSWGGTDRQRDDASQTMLAEVKPSLTSIVAQGGSATVKTQQDVARIHGALAREVNDGTALLGFDLTRVWAQKSFVVAL